MEVLPGNVVNQEAITSVKLNLFLMKAKLYWINLVNIPIHQILIRYKKRLYIRI